MNSFWGVDPAQLEQLGSDIDARQARLTDLAEALGGIVTQADWRGPDADAFRTQWSGTMVGLFAQAADQLRRHAEEARSNAEEQDAASSASEGAGGGIPHGADDGVSAGAGGAIGAAVGGPLHGTIGAALGGTIGASLGGAAVGGATGGAAGAAIGGAALDSTAALGGSAAAASAGIGERARPAVEPIIRFLPRFRSLPIVLPAPVPFPIGPVQPLLPLPAPIAPVQPIVPITPPGGLMPLPRIVPSLSMPTPAA